MFRPKTNLLKTVNPKSMKLKAIPCSIDPVECIDLVCSSHTSRAVTLDTAGVCKVSLSEWDSSNGNAFVANSPSSPRAATARDVSVAEESITSKHVRSDGRRHTFERVTTRKAPTTTRGKVGYHPTTTARLASPRKVKSACVVLTTQCSFITWMGITQTVTHLTWNPCANAAISLSTIARLTYRRWSSFINVLVPSAARGSHLQDHEGKSARLAGNTRRYSQCPVKAGVSRTLNYGMKDKLLASRLKCTVREAEILRLKYMARYPAVEHFYQEAIEETRKSGYAYTVMGRRRFLPEIASRDNFDRFQAERQAVNMQIQGSAADAAKMAMNNIYYHSGAEQTYGAKMLLQIHDELIFECPEDTAEEALSCVQWYMSHPFPKDLAVPLTVSGGVANNWAEAK